MNPLEQEIRPNDIDSLLNELGIAGVKFTNEQVELIGAYDNDPTSVNARELYKLLGGETVHMVAAHNNALTPQRVLGPDCLPVILHKADSNDSLAS